VNIFENGFLDVFKAAQRNLAIFRAANPNCGQTGSPACNYGNSGLTGQVAVPIIQTALGSATDSTTVTLLQQGQAGRLANNIAGNVSRMNSLITAGLIPSTTLPDGKKVSNFFVVNPQTSNGAFVMTNGIDTQFNALQIELRRRLSSGLLVQGSYQFGKAMANAYGNAQSAAIQPRTLRDLNADRGPSPWDIRHTFKVDWLYELPIGRGKPFLSGHIPVLGKLIEGWQTGGVARLQSGPAVAFTSGRQTVNQFDAGVILHNISAKQLQEMVKIRKTTVCDPNCHGVVFWLPDSILRNTYAAFEINNRQLKDLDPNAPYIGPADQPGQLGYNLFLYGPAQYRFDLNLIKNTRITERTSFEGRVQFLNAFNRPNFFVGSPTASNRTIAVNSAALPFGQTRSAYRDITVSGTNDPGGRIVEFQLRLRF